VNIFKSQALLYTLRSLIQAFQEEVIQGALSVTLVKSLTDCLKLHTLQIKTSRNQMMLKLNESDECKQISAQVIEFC